MLETIDHAAGTPPIPGTTPRDRTTALEPQHPHRPTHHTAVVALLPIRLFLAAGWLRAAAEKLIDPQWWTGAKLRTFLTAQHHDALPFFRPVMEHAIAPNARLVAIVVVATQLLCGIAIAIGRPMRLALRWACVLNIVFIMCGKVNPSCFYLVMQIVLLFAIADGLVGVRPSHPSRRTIVAALLSAGFAAAAAPYVRTTEPAKVIEDPAMMFVTLGVIMCITLLMRRSAYLPPHRRTLRRVWTTWYAGWIHAKPTKVVRNEYERRYNPVGMRFAPPQHGTAVSIPPPLVAKHVERDEARRRSHLTPEFSTR
jgi:uncharacterized membrane protein YphA (DoxX/SURF4 family)